MKLNECGIQHYLSDHAKITGQIKKYCCDFEVHEIDLHGNIAGFDVNNERNVKRLKFDDANNTVDLTVEVSDISAKDVDTERKQVADSDICWNDISKDASGHLETLIGSESLAKIKEVATCAMDFPNYIKLGIFNDKTDRNIIHQCIRYISPRFVTKTTKCELNTEMFCNFDPLYKQMLDMGVFKDIAKDVFRFVYCRSMWSAKHGLDKNLTVTVDDYDKTSRKNFHHFIQQHFGKLLESKTVKRDSKNCISIRFKEKRVKNLLSGELKRKKNVTIVTLHRENLELLDVLHKLSNELGIHLSCFKYAGLKDKKAKTFQFVSITGTTPEKINNATAQNFSGWCISNPVHASSELQLGDLSGNFFKIVIRNISCDEGMETFHFVYKRSIEIL